MVSHQTVKIWNVRFGGLFADEIKKQRRRPTRRWHIDEMHCKIAGKKHYLWRAVDSDGTVLDIFVSKRRNKKAAKKFFSRLFGQYQAPSRLTTDRYRLYRSVVPETFPKTKHIKGKWLNNRVENSHIIIREREKKLKKFKSTVQAQTFLDRLEFIRSYLKPKQHLMASSTYGNSVKYRLRIWSEISMIPLFLLKNVSTFSGEDHFQVVVEKTARQPCAPRPAGRSRRDRRLRRLEEAPCTIPAEIVS